MDAMKHVIVLGAALAVLVAGAAFANGAKVVPVELRDGRAAAAPSIKVTRGDDVVLRWHSDRPIVLHLHGYDIEHQVPASSASDMAFKATVAGRFPITEHAHGKSHHHRPVAYLEVHP